MPDLTDLDVEVLEKILDQNPEAFAELDDSRDDIEIELL